MPGKKNPFQGIGEGITKVTCETAWANVEITGTGAHASNALKRAGWDAKTPMAAVMMTVSNGSIQGTEWILRGSLGDVVVPLQRVQEDKLMKATLNLNDLSKVKFPTVTNPTGGGPNHSMGMDGADVTTSLTSRGTSLTEESAIKSSDFMKNKGFSLRWVVYPTSGQTAFLGLSMAPGNPERLRPNVGRRMSQTQQSRHAQ